MVREMKYRSTLGKKVYKKKRYHRFKKKLASLQNRSFVYTVDSQVWIQIIMVTY